MFKVKRLKIKRKRRDYQLKIKSNYFLSFIN